ncbi:alpha-L-fucosidase [Mucilaginibacter sp. 21P]|uniref:alpha-L-fucosidase n=1 Tax=Mucilaginibacter sp. 21P TaxID=2778902 RepID=UPI001C5682DF|nr:alpha-L-fucosidase [Mucilaginibacter sp. 21P]QXV64703.1 alpha-L-fucosidase [Mucilaginibacter sp. 21P]
MRFSTLIITSFLFIPVILFAQSAPKPYGRLPSERQLHWQETEMYSIIHFSMATFSDKEWGYGDEPLSSFAPSHFDASKILATVKAAGIKGIVVVAKHHDGFCLWPTKTTSHNISNTPYKNGKGDIVKEYQLACKKLGLKMGIYCSPWDRNNQLYGDRKYVTEVYRKQLTELYLNYGDLFMSWHDGANGGDGFYGGARSQRKIDKSNYYGWDSTFRITRKLQSGAAIFGDAGPDVRWIGNEEGVAGEPCWETFTPHAVEGDNPTNGNVKYWESVNGTRDGKYWIPAECDVPLRPGWFYHQSEDGQSKTPYQLVKLYYESVGRGACLDLGLSPDKSGLLTMEDTKNLKDFGAIIRSTFAVNLAKQAKFTASDVRGKNAGLFGPQHLTDPDRYSYWATNDNVAHPQLMIDLKRPEVFNVIRLRENIKLGQRIDSVRIDAFIDNNWVKIAGVTSIGANRLIRLKTNILAQKIRLSVFAPVCIALSDFGLFKEPDHLSPPIIRKTKDGKIEITTDAPVRALRYTIDGKSPGILSKVYNGPFSLVDGGTVKALSFSNSQKQSAVAVTTFDQDKNGWSVSSSLPSIPEALNRAIDDNEQTFWFDEKNEQESDIREIIVDMGKPKLITAFTYLPRQDKKPEGIINSYEFYTSDDGKTWSANSIGEFANIISNPIKQVVSLGKPITARYFKLAAKRIINNRNPAIAEIGIR